MGRTSEAVILLILFKSMITTSYDILRPLLTEYTTFLNDLYNQEYAQQRLNISKKMIMALRLKAKGKFTKESRIEVAFGEANWYLKEYGKSMERISRVRCKFCGQRSIFVCHYGKYRPPDVTQIYRIPGIWYDIRSPESVGLVVCQHKIIVFMTYGTLVLQCHVLEQVDWIQLNPADDI
jgi:hypothetical protein